MTVPTLEHKTLPLSIKAVGDDGTFEGYLSTFNNVDLTNEVVEPGAFAESIIRAEARRKRINKPYLWQVRWQHDRTKPIGGFTEAREDEHGLWVKGQLDLDIEAGRDAYSGLKKGYLDSMSIGYRVLKDRWQDGLCYLSVINLGEGSIVSEPANEEALVGSVKAADFATLDAANVGYTLAQELRQKFDTLLAAICGCCCDEELPDTANRMAGVSQSIMQFAADCEQCCGEAFSKAEAAGVPVQMPTPYVPGMPLEMSALAAPADAAEQKAGRVLSGANRKRISASADALRSALEVLSALLEATDPAAGSTADGESGAGKATDADATTEAKASETLADGDGDDQHALLALLTEMRGWRARQIA